MNRILVTGAASFTARHLFPVLAERFPEARLAGTDLPPRGPEKGEYYPADITRRHEIAAVLEAVSPDLLIHLAGVASNDADRCYAVNLEGTRNALQSAAALPSPPSVLLISSAAVYGHTRPEDNPVVETTPLRPVSAYGASKAAAELFALALHRQERLPVLVVRPFNLIGPGLPLGLAPSDFAAQVARIRRGEAPPVLRVGNLNPRRDFIDARDAVRAYALLAADPSLYGRVFNLGTGKPVTIWTLIEGLLAAAGVEARMETDPARVRAVEVEEQIADLRAVEKATRWRPEIPFETSLREMVEEA